MEEEKLNLSVDICSRDGQIFSFDLFQVYDMAQEQLYRSWRVHIMEKRGPRYLKLLVSVSFSSLQYKSSVACVCVYMCDGQVR